MGYSIGEVANAAGVTPRAVRLYESRGLLPPADRSSAGYRVFDDRHVEMLSFIRRARSLDLSLDAIGEIVALAGSETRPCERTQELLDRRLAEIDQRIADLQRLRATITKARHRGSRLEGVRCAIIEGADLAIEDGP